LTGLMAAPNLPSQWFGSRLFSALWASNRSPLEKSDRTSILSVEPDGIVMAQAADPQRYAAFRAELALQNANLPPRLREIASFVVRYPSEIAFATVAQIAAQAHVQPSAVIRFCKAMGLDGYSELQALCRQSLSRQDHATRLERLRDQDQASSRASASAGFVLAAIHSLQTLSLETLDEAIEVAANQLQPCATLQVIGLRRMFSVAASLVYGLGALGLRARLIDQAGGLGPESAQGFDPRDGMIAISFAPYASATLALATLAKEAGLPVVAITDSPLSPLVPIASAVIEISEADHAGFRSLAATMATASALATRIAAIRQH
jgi:DNA-binding MurR/RpiR family transcriptional regulator